MESKRELRKQIASIKRTHSASSLESLSQAVLASLETNAVFKAASTVLLYHSLPDEVRTAEFVERWHCAKRILLPVVVDDDLELRVYTGRDSMRVGAYGILEPTGPLFTDYDSIDLAVVPGVAFTRDGVRLGRGKGYYDRLLPRIKSPKVGICFPFQILESIPAEPLDVKMDEVVAG
jgi:5-formyltetrahydrofolate cyclo-ligase